MEKIYNVIENRGYGITYVDFTGTIEECNDHIGRMMLQQQEDNHDLKNGDGQDYEYTIEEA